MLNNIKSKKILNIILRTLRKRIELKIFKYNKGMQKKLNIRKEDFEKFKFLKEINTKFNLDIKDIENQELNLEAKNLGNEIIEYFKKAVFNEIKILNLEKNEISRLDGLNEVKFEKLEILKLGKNNIYNIYALEKVNFK